METIALILPFQATTVNNPSNSSGVTAGAISGEITGVTAVLLIEYDRSTDSALMTAGLISGALIE